MMLSRHIASFGCFLLVLATCGGVASAADPPSPIDELVLVRPFVLETPYRHRWCAERPLVREGYLLVLRVDPALVRPRATETPVLYVGTRTAEHVNAGTASGYVVVLVPSALAPRDPEHVDLARATIWFGAPDFPERVDGAEATRQLDRARSTGLRPRATNELSTARARGGDALQVTDKDVLLAHAADLVATYAPDETALVRRLRAGTDATVPTEGLANE